jgi:acid phosphatase
LLDRFESFSQPFRGSLEFVNTWAYFTDSVTPEFEDLTTSGPYAGTLEAFTTGQRLREHYKHLLSVRQPTHFWSCNSPRDIATAEWFANGFFGLNWTTSQVAKLHIIPETSDRGADTLTPSDTCLRYIEDKTSGHDQGYSKLALWQDKFTKPIAHRLSAENGGFAFSDMEIYSMMEMCGFEILVRGESPWCEVFTKDEWLDFEYARDLLHFYRAGPGNKYAGAMGWLWLNATQSLLLQEGTGGVYFSFVHDSDIVLMLATLGIYNGDELLERKQNEREVDGLSYLPTDSIVSNRSWRTSDLVPMGGRIIVERLNCRKSTSMDQSRAYIRLVINDGITAIGDSYRNGMATLESFQQLLHDRGEVVGDFREICGLNDSAPNSITFLHQ